MHCKKSKTEHLNYHVACQRALTLLRRKIPDADLAIAGSREKFLVVVLDAVDTVALYVKNELG